MIGCTIQRIGIDGITEMIGIIGINEITEMIEIVGNPS